MISFASLAWIVFGILMGVIFMFSILISRSKKGTVLSSLASTIAGGHFIVDKAGHGEVAMVIDVERNETTRKYRLLINCPQKFSEYQTEFIFSDEDFNPEPDAWENFSGTITLYKNFEGDADYRDAPLKALTERLRHYRTLIMSYKRMAHEGIQILEGEKLPSGDHTKLYKETKLLSNLKNIVSETNVETGDSGGSGDDSMIY